MKNSLFVLLTLITFGLVTFSCKKDHKHAHVNIEILSPTDNITLSDPANTNINIKFSSEEDLHDIEVILINATTGDSIAPFNPLEIHQHVKNYEFNQSVDLSSYPAGTEFHLEAVACENHECTEKAIKSVHFRK